MWCKKRIFDLIVLAIFSPLICVVFFICHISVFISDPFSEVMYFQDRIGKNGKKYRIWKFRTMRPDSDKMNPEDFLKTKEELHMWRKYQKISNDPRITVIGKFLRKTSLDEIPQFWNVFIGDMSLVGPRPILKDQIDMYSGNKYFDMLPGITGFWQVSKRNSSSFSSRARYDDFYWKKSSIKTDIIIIFKTLSVVLKMTGT
jgi:exopolysaccharide production protein ExoY